MTLFVGLTVNFCFLVYYINKYFKSHMKSEMRRLSVLFGTFTVAYFLRFIYELGLGLHSDIYVSAVPDLAVRLGISQTLPILWDITSIMCILILHNSSFR